MSWASEIVLPLIIAGLAALPGLAALRSQNLKRKAESDAVVSDAWKELLDPFRERVKALEEDARELRIISEKQAEEIASLRRENTVLINGVNLLTSQLRASNIEPVWVYKGHDERDKGTK